ncbi:hypothetical protein B2J93_5040 [Marssonina coronariae]|uniref:Uncharacterized protein n=1 Tax=Diplocarpon coronariae TaxID=2795749 RepID=A0A218Z4A7_9HELO|nr:hypothetical protein B2J93_5040 [Marssonina coronariae]
MNFSNDSLSSVLRTIRTFVTNACTVDTALACPALPCPAFELRYQTNVTRETSRYCLLDLFSDFTLTLRQLAVYSCNWTPSKPLLSAILLITASRPDKHFLPLLLIHPFTSPFPRTSAPALDSSTHTRPTLLQQRNPGGIPRYPALPQAHLAVELPLPNSARQHHVRIHTSRISMRSLPLHREGMVHSVRKDTQALPPCRGRGRVQAIVASQPSPAGCPNTILSRVVGGRAGEFELEEAARPHGGELLGGEGEESSRENKTIGTVRRVGPDTYSAHLLGDGVGSFGILRAGIQASVGEGILELDMGIAWDVVEEEAVEWGMCCIGWSDHRDRRARARSHQSSPIQVDRATAASNSDQGFTPNTNFASGWHRLERLARFTKTQPLGGHDVPPCPACRREITAKEVQRCHAEGHRSLATRGLSVTACNALLPRDREGATDLIPPPGVAHLMSPLPAAAQPILAGREGVTSRKRRRGESLARASGGVDAPGHRTKRAATASSAGIAASRWRGSRVHVQRLPPAQHRHPPCADAVATNRRRRTTPAATIPRPRSRARCSCAASSLVSRLSS